ncbi:GtrA family protein [Bacillus pinisoli]|uniref:GtrA family protein n=1 Tax=Bacillus pinisoli TaxID=2901866 RepID=UPI002342E109|nr:GtrA family protein [Bacillus pinisoli]
MNQGLFHYLPFLKRTNSFTRFLLVGVVNTLVGLSLIFILIKLGINYWTSTFLGNSMGAIISYFLNRSFTFDSRVSLQKGAPSFILVILICYVGSYTVSKWFISLTGAPPYLPSFLTEQDLAVLAGALLYTLSNYIGQKYIVFSKAVS